MVYLSASVESESTMGDLASLGLLGRAVALSLLTF